MNLFYTPQINQNDTQYALSEEESGHAMRVLRMKIGDPIFSTDGNGYFYQGTITDGHPRKCLVKIGQVIQDHARQNFELTIAISPTKTADRFEWFLEKATEIGCKEIIPIKCEHSERTTIKPERLKKVLVSAMKQSLKSRLPILHDLLDFETLLVSTFEFSGQKFIGHIAELSEAEFPTEQLQGPTLTKIYIKGNNALVIIGPEGGFSDEEVKSAVNKNCIPVRLGNSRLRVETAGVAACAILNSLNSN